MPKIQNIGVGNYIRSIRGRSDSGSRGMNHEVWKIMVSDGNSFRCYPIVNGAVDDSRIYNVPIDTVVEQVTI